MKGVKKIPVITPTQKQRDWLDAEKERTGNTEAAIIRGLIQEKMEGK